MANYWTKKDDESEELRTIKPWEQTISNGDKPQTPPPPHNIKQLAQTRYSVRNYQPTPISHTDLQYILQCAQLAPSAVNKQPWHFYICHTPDTLNKVCQTYQRDWIQTAPLIIVCCICHDQEWIRKIDQQPHGIVDISIAAEHICLAATELGIGTCWVCNFNPTLCSQLLNLPPNQQPAILIPMGYPQTNDIPQKIRKPLSEITTILP